jgi:hypothetical protein
MLRSYPFLISCTLIIVGLVAGVRLDARLNRYVTGDPTKDFNPKLTGDLDHLQPGSLRNVVCYWIDLTQATALVIGPVLGVLIFVDLSNPGVATAYAISILVGIALIIWLCLVSDERTYSGRRGRLGLTMVSTVGLSVNVICAVIAYFFSRR